jgi:lipopolysaccharide export system protein LptA
MSTKIYLALVLSALLLPGTLYALSTDKDKPMEIEADRVDVDEKTGLSTFRGKVQVTKGSIRLNADTVVVYEKNGELDKIIATGEPVYFRQRPDNKQEDVVAEANRIEFYNRKNLIYLIDKAKITQERDTFSGDRIEYDTLRSVVLAKKAPSGSGRVKITIQPKKQ